MSNAASDPLAPTKSVVAGNKKCDQPDDLREAWSPSEQEANTASDPLAPAESVVAGNLKCDQPDDLRGAWSPSEQEANTASDPLAPAESVVAGNEECDQPDDLHEAWSPFEQEANAALEAPVPCNSPVGGATAVDDAWGCWEDSPEAPSSPAPAVVPSPAPEPSNTIHIGDFFFPVAMATSGHLLATAFSQQTGRFWTGAVTIHDVTAEPHLINSFALENTTSCIAFCDDSDHSVLVALDDGSLVQLGLPNGATTQTRCEHDQPIKALAVSPGLTRAFSCDQSGCVCVWDPMVALENLVRRPSRSQKPSDTTLAAHPVLERRFVSAGLRTVRLWDEEVVKKFTVPRTGQPGSVISYVDWTKENYLLVGWTDGTIQSIDIRRSETPLWSIDARGQGREILGLCATASGAVVSISADNCLRELRPGTGKAAQRWGLSGGSVWSGRCEDKMVTAMATLSGPEAAVLACCRDQTWWRWRDGGDSVERFPIAANMP